MGQRSRTPRRVAHEVRLNRCPPDGVNPSFGAWRTGGQDSSGKKATELVHDEVAGRPVGNSAAHLRPAQQNLTAVVGQFDGGEQAMMATADHDCLVCIHAERSLIGSAVVSRGSDR